MANVDFSGRQPLPEDLEALRACAQALRQERDQYQRLAEEQQHLAEEQRQQAEQQRHRAEEHSRQTAQLQAEILRLQAELERYKRWYYGPRADRLRTPGELAQLLLQFAEEWDQKPVAKEDPVSPSEPDGELRRVQRRKGRRDLARFENLPVTTHIYELSEAERACPGCGQERKEIGAEESWQVEYIPGRFERLQHIRKKYACPQCESQGESPQITTVAKRETAIDKGLAGPGLLAYIVTSKFAEYTPPLPIRRCLCKAGLRHLARHASGLVPGCG